jgi:hypothetical protein
MKKGRNALRLFFNLNVINGLAREEGDQMS